MKRFNSIIGNLLVLIAATALCFALPACKSSKLEPGGAYAPVVTTVNPDGTSTVTPGAAPDTGFFLVDSAYDLAYATADAAFTFERDNRVMLWKVSPEIKHALDKVRPVAVEVRDKYAAARTAYMANPTPAGLSTLNDLLSRAKQLADAAQAALPK